MKMLLPIYMLLWVMFASCNSNIQTQNKPTDTATAAGNNKAGDTNEETINEYEDAYIVIADTCSNYMVLDNAIYQLGNQLHLPVDTMNRHYDKTKNKIVLADDDEDEMYRGEYYPRREQDTCFLSLEHADQYFAGNTCDTSVFALVIDICTTQHRADSLKKWIGSAAPKTMVVRTKVYTGCMH